MDSFTKGFLNLISFAAVMLLAAWLCSAVGIAGFGTAMAVVGIELGVGIALTGLIFTLGTFFKED